ncbi:hypothetical protein Tco_1015827 [Tanacetum coccineum]|uniref:Retroviral polymerase SH3-like domain-containing protein n=1 Tax=Tanacetum coccineum TaxID=301880 RepID=A0ABQ5FNS6_9ASTR
MRKIQQKERERKFEDNRFATTEGITRRIDYSLIRLKNQRCRVLYKVEDIATCLVEYVKFWDDWEVDRYGNANLDYDSEEHDAISSKKKRRYPKPALTKDHRRIKINTPHQPNRASLPNINFLHVYGCLVYFHNHKDHLGKFDEKADDGYIGYSLVSKAFRVFNTRRQQTEETYHIIFDESPDAIKFSKPSVDNINIVENKRYPPDEYLHPYEPSQIYQTNSNDVSFIEPYESPEPVVLETEVSSDQNEDTSVQDTISIPNPPLPIPSVVTPAPQDRWSQDKHIELVNIIGNPGARMLTRAIAKQLSAAVTPPN